ncbi:MAG: DJ-1/PfpI family protein [Clostridia bacterium]|nr:DJ-1/PfpI family protein [Clostridia bacterium]
MIYLFLAEGFEEIEALAPLDMLRRASIPVSTVGVGGKMVKGAHNVCVMADTEEENVDFENISGVILPGGMPGTKNLEACETVQKAIDICINNQDLVAAICAAPSILGHKGLLAGKKATCFPGFEKDCTGANVLSQSVVTDGNIITARGAGCALSFGGAIVAYLKQDTDVANQLLQDMQWNYEGHKRV